MVDAESGMHRIPDGKVARPGLPAKCDRLVDGCDLNANTPPSQ
jgi:hypothetical protein